MKLAIVTEGIPGPSSGGAALTMWTAVKYMSETGHKITLLLLLGQHQSHSIATHRAQLQAVAGLGVEIVPLDLPLQVQGSCLEGLSRRPAARFAGAMLASVVDRELAVRAPDAILAYHFDAVAATYRTTVAPVLAAVGDPAHLPPYYAWREQPVALRPRYVRQTVGMLLSRLTVPAAMRTMMSRAAASGCFAAHHAAWFRRIGVRECRYFRTPIVDDVGRDWRAQQARLKEPGRFKVLLIGHLKGTATLSGLSLFAREVLPALERQIGSDGLEVHIVGGYELPLDLALLLARPCVKMRGQVEPAAAEFLSSDVVLVPTPIKLGIRIRILTAFSFGACVVTHRANTSGIPELAHDDNALLADSGPGLAAAVLRVFRDRQFGERIGDAGRATYERYFAPDVAGEQLVAAMREISERSADGRQGLRVR